MIDIIKPVLTLTILLLTSFAGMARAHCDDDCLSPPELRVIDLPNWKALRSTHVIDGFPAIAESGTEVALLRSLDTTEETVALDVMGVDGGLLKRFALFPEYGDGNIDSEDARQRLATGIVAPNAYLTEGKFKRMARLFDQTNHYVPVWELEFRGLRIRYENDGSILQITSLKDEQRSLRIEWPTRMRSIAGKHGDFQCEIQGLPMKGWIDSSGELFVLYIKHDGGTFIGCNEPEEWRVLRLPPA